MSSDNYPQFPLYIPSLGRHKYMITSRALTLMGVKHNIVVEPHEVKLYENAVKRDKLLTTVIPLDMSFKQKYDYCDSFGTTRSTGSGPARNFIWEHAKATGATHHWIMDDNISSFRRLNKNTKIKCESPAFWRSMEDFALRYKNVGMSGPHYAMFAPAKAHRPPFLTNTRIYSCNLIRNDLPFRWRGRYNEDTILSLDMLKAGWCTILYYAFLQEKLATQTVKGGNTDSVYTDGTANKSLMLVNEHPDVSVVSMKYGRTHHHVSYENFKWMKLIKHYHVKKTGQNKDYGMGLRKK
tara:strand:- start:1668 stop:2552 length:885 start_codon:yes stop_codon:yes gene_type:complete